MVEEEEDPRFGPLHLADDKLQQGFVRVPGGAAHDLRGHPGRLGGVAKELAVDQSKGRRLKDAPLAASTGKHHVPRAGEYRSGA